MAEDRAESVVVDKMKGWCKLDELRSGAFLLLKQAFYSLLRKLFTMEKICRETMYRSAQYRSLPAPQGSPPDPSYGSSGMAPSASLNKNSRLNLALSNGSVAMNFVQARSSTFSGVRVRQFEL